MSQENTETLIRDFYDAFNRRDFDAIEAVIPDDVVIAETPGFNPTAGKYRGRAEARRYFEGWFKFWKTVEGNPISIHLGSEGKLAVRVRVTVTGQESDLAVTDDWGHVFETSGGMILRMTLYRTPEEALEAAGLAE